MRVFSRSNSSPLLVASASLLLLIVVSSAISRQSLPSARNVVVPGFGPDGIRSWELRASQATSVRNGFILAREVLLSTFQGSSLQTLAKSPVARFHPDHGVAESNASIFVEGLRYEIQGEGWQWDSNRSRMHILTNARTAFDDRLTSFLSLDDSDHCASKEPLPARVEDEANATQPTIITSRSLDLVTTPEGHRFLFTGEVVVLGTNLTVHCHQLEILSNRDANSSVSGEEVGGISFIEAKGSVKIRQEGRFGSAEKAAIDVPAGIVTLIGSARLEDDRGKLSGETITWERGKRAVVRSGVDGRARVELPPLPDFGLGKKLEDPSDKSQKKPQ